MVWFKHNGSVTNLEKFNKILGNNFFKNKIKFKNQPSLEAQISAISDDIAYNSHDLEDGLKANLFGIEDLAHIPMLNEIVKRHNKKLSKFDKELVLRQIVRETINEMVKDIILNTKLNLKFNNIKSLLDVYKSDDLLVLFSKKMSLFDISIKQFLRERMYYSPTVLNKTNKGKKIIKILFKKICNNPKKFIKIKINKDTNKERVVCDFIAGMTDRFAINLYNKLK